MTYSIINYTTKELSLIGLYLCYGDVFKFRIRVNNSRTWHVAYNYMCIVCELLHRRKDTGTSFGQHSSSLCPEAVRWCPFATPCCCRLAVLVASGRGHRSQTWIHVSIHKSTPYTTVVHSSTQDTARSCVSPGDCGDTINKLCLEENVGVVEHSVLQRDNYELRVSEVRAQHLADVLGVGEIQCSVYLVQDVDRGGLEEEERENER